MSTRQGIRQALRSTNNVNIENEYHWKLNQTKLQLHISDVILPKDVLTTKVHSLPLAHDPKSNELKDALAVLQICVELRSDHSQAMRLVPRDSGEVVMLHVKEDVVVEVVPHLASVV